MICSYAYACPTSWVFRDMFFSARVRVERSGSVVWTRDGVQKWQFWGIWRDGVTPERSSQILQPWVNAFRPRAPSPTSFSGVLCCIPFRFIQLWNFCFNVIWMQHLQCRFHKGILLGQLWNKCKCTRVITPTVQLQKHLIHLTATNSFPRSFCFAKETSNSK